MGSQYQDLATLSGMSKFSAGQIQQFPGYHVQHNPAIAAKFENALRFVCHRGFKVLHYYCRMFRVISLKHNYLDLEIKCHFV